MKKIQEQSFAIKNVRVFDGHEVHNCFTVVVENGKIAQFANATSIEAQDQVIDGEGLTLLPGLIDSHTHIWGEDHLRQAIQFGVTTELDMFMDYATAAELKLASLDNSQMADLRSACTCITAPGGHGTQYNLKIPTINSVSECEPFVDSRIAEGSDYIKIIYESGKGHGFFVPSISKEILSKLIVAAHNRSKMAVVHIGSYEEALDAATAGADCLAHLFNDKAADREFVDAVVKNRTFVIPTLSVIESTCGIASGAGLVLDADLNPYFSLVDVRNLKSAFMKSRKNLAEMQVALQAVRFLHAEGVPILAGSDAPNPGTIHGASLHRELELLVQAGLSPLEALQAATSVPARHFGLEDRGQIAVGLRADLLLVRGDPTTEITNTRQIVSVWRSGILIDRDLYRASVKLEKDENDFLRNSEAPAGLGAGLISDFAAGQPTTSFGQPWQIITDEIWGGKSQAKLSIVSESPLGHKASLLISGYVVNLVRYSQAGIIFFPGKAPWEPANLSSKSAIKFWAKGDGKAYWLLLSAKHLGRIPASVSFVAENEWRQMSFSWTDFEGMSGHDIEAISIVSMSPGGFSLQIAQVELE